jgi:hypothetical protein
MASKDVEVTGPQTVGFDLANFSDVNWETVHLEQPDQLTFDTIGDTLVAIYLGQEVIEFEREDRKTGEKTAEQFTQLRFMLPGDNPAVVNAGFDLLKAFAKVPLNHLVKVHYLKDIDVDQASPMKSYRVLVGPDMSETLAAG